MRAFVADLANVLDVQSGGAAKQSTVNFFAAAAGQVAWTAPYAIDIVAIMPVGGSTNVCLGTDASSFTTNFSAAGNLKLGSVIWLGGINTNQFIFHTRFHIEAFSKVWFTNNSASNAGLLMYFEKA